MVGIDKDNLMWHLEATERELSKYYSPATNAMNRIRALQVAVKELLEIGKDKAPGKVRMCSEIEQLIDIGLKAGLDVEKLNVFVRFMFAYSPGAHPDYAEECADRFLGNPLKSFDEEWHGILNNKHFGIDWEGGGCTTCKDWKSDRGKAPCSTCNGSTYSNWTKRGA